MTARSLIPRLTDIIEAIERIRDVVGNMPLDGFETDWRRQWLVERGVETISGASRHLTDELKARHPEIPWPRAAAAPGKRLRRLDSQSYCRELSKKTLSARWCTFCGACTFGGTPLDAASRGVDIRVIARLGNF